MGSKGEAGQRFMSMVPGEGTWGRSEVDFVLQQCGIGRNNGSSTPTTFMTII